MLNVRRVQKVTLITIDTLGPEVAGNGRSPYSDYDAITNHPRRRRRHHRRTSRRHRSQTNRSFAAWR